MTSIAYITDYKLLDLHRLNAHKTMNFWRLSNNVNFKEFNKGDLVFFLSKDKEHLKNKEKGIMGYGHLKEIHLNTIKWMWDKYGDLNGYNSIDEFKEAILKVSKDHKLPEKISSFYLEGVVFFQMPIYLSECGMNISNNIESYTYLKPENITIKLLEYGKRNLDVWSNSDQPEIIEKDQLTYSLFMIHSKIGEMSNDEKLIKKAYKKLKEIDGDFIQDSKLEKYKIFENTITIYFYHDKDFDSRLIIGQANLYQYYFDIYYPYDVKLKFKTIDEDVTIKEILK